jgi:hypothetical protein
LLRKFGRAAKADSEIDTGGAEFKFMLQYLPSGNQLPSWAKRELRELFLWIKKRPALAKLQDALFEIRFARELEDDWHLNDDPEDIDTLWKLLKDLPDTNVEGNTSLNEIFLEAGEGGGWYNPGSGDIHLGSDELADQERFEDVMRHEVGHAVHEMHSALVDEWLMKQFGWRMFGADPNGIDAWVNLMGGYGSVTPAQRSEIRGFLIQALGPGSKWGPPRMPTAPSF